MKKSTAQRRLAHIVVCAIALLAASSGLSRAGNVCPNDPELGRMRLPHLRSAIAAGKEGLIVALGSSSTTGAMASDSAHTYPAILQGSLTSALPHAHFAVINRGIGGQDAPEELSRLDTDAIALHPQLVIWQVGANGAMRHADPANFHRTMEDGVNRLLKAGIDVILMDNQRTPRILAAAEHGVLEDALRDVAQETEVNMFSRGHLMDAWSDAGAKPVLFTAPDGLHQNDLGYLCISQTLSRQIVAAITSPLAVAASR